MYQIELGGPRLVVSEVVAYHFEVDIPIRYLILLLAPLTRVLIVEYTEGTGVARFAQVSFLVVVFGVAADF